jgi:processive 1,2-diacylglycerol beta-glucosyltransferase
MINETKPDVIYCTHFYPAMALSLLRQAYKVPPVVIASSLDYAVEPFFDKARNIDYITIANEEFIPGRLHSGYKLEQIKVTGIPTLDKFYEKHNKAKIRKELGLDTNKFTILIMFGGGEWAGTYKIYKELVKAYKKDIQVIVINGSNKKTFNKINKLETPSNIKLLNIGYTTEVEKYMWASDIALTKAGGLSTTEMVNIGLPMLISTKVYGQEERNMDFMVAHGVALSFKNTHDLSEKIDIAMEIKDLFVSKFPLIRKKGADNIASLILNQEVPEYDDNYIASLDYKKMKRHMKILLDETIHITSKKLV